MSGSGRRPTGSPHCGSNSRTPDAPYSFRNRNFNLNCVTTFPPLEDGRELLVEQRKIHFVVPGTLSLQETPGNGTVVANGVTARNEG